MAKIILAHSEIGLNDYVRQSASLDGHQVIETTNPSQLLQLMLDNRADMLIIDHLVLTRDQGVCRSVRADPDLYNTPILALIPRKDAVEVARMLDVGCDDCVPTTLTERELAARIRALLRRNMVYVRPSQLTLHTQARTVTVGKRDVPLTPREYALLEVLCELPGEHIPTPTLLQRVWNYPPGKGDPALVRNHIRNLRRKLEDDPERPRIVICYQGRGYLISAQVSKH